MDLALERLTLEAKIDSLTLDMREVLNKLDIALSHPLFVLPSSGCTCKDDEVYGKSPGYTAFKVEKDRQAGINTLTHDEVA